jgi:small-conductance mechanosensitive channel
MGTVEHDGLKTTRLRSLSGEQIVLANTDLLKGRLHNFKRLSERHVVFTLSVAQDTQASKLALIPTIIREAIDAQPKARFDRAHFKKYDGATLIFESAFYFGDHDYNLYMDVQQAINLAIHRRLQQEGIIPASRTPTDDVNEREQERAESGSPAPDLARNTAH